MAKYSITAPALVFLFCLSAASVSGNHGTPVLTPKADDNGICSSMVEPQGYVCQEHKVTTKDGYILSIQRMPAALSGKPADKPPVLLQHGLFSDGFVWLLNFPDESLAFILADNGYDVWIANSRGTTYSRGHTSLSPTDSAYWDWSWDELAAFDLPAIFQYVNDQTGQKLHYVGHSLGTLMAFAAFSQGKLLNMLRSSALLCPIAHLSQIESPLTKEAADLFLAEDLYWLGLHEFVPGGQAASKLIGNVCETTGLNCSNLMAAFTGPACCVNDSRINIFLDHELQSTSTKNIVHLAQMIRTGNISMYDYGSEDANMDHYRQPTPPSYNIASIPNNLPLFLAHGGNDSLSDNNDVNVLLENLKDHDGDKLVQLYRDDYAHTDFVFGVNANEAVYDPLMAFFKLN